MPRKSRAGSKYPANWKEISTRIKDEAGWCCVRCGHPHDRATGHVLTCHHLDLDPSNSAWWNLIALCQRCHLTIQAKVDLARPWVMTDHSAWFRPFVAGWYARRYEGKNLTRAEVEANLDRLLELERQALGVAP
jgi:hypothetical protein